MARRRTHTHLKTHKQCNRCSAAAWFLNYNKRLEIRRPIRRHKLRCKSSGTHQWGWLVMAGCGEQQPASVFLLLFLPHVSASSRFNVFSPFGWSVPSNPAYKVAKGTVSHILWSHDQQEIWHASHPYYPAFINAWTIWQKIQNKGNHWICLIVFTLISLLIIDWLLLLKSESCQWESAPVLFKLGFGK